MPKNKAIILHSRQPNLGLTGSHIACSNHYLCHQDDLAPYRCTILGQIATSDSPIDRETSFVDRRGQPTDEVDLVVSFWTSCVILLLYFYAGVGGKGGQRFSASRSLSVFVPCLLLTRLLRNTDEHGRTPVHIVLQRAYEMSIRSWGLFC